MKFFAVLCGLLLSILATPSCIFSQSAPGTDQPRPLVLTEAIATPGLVGRFDHFVDKAQEACAGAAYAPFPELQKLAR